MPVTRLDASDGSAVELTDFAPRYRQHGRVFHPMSMIRIVRPLSGAFPSARRSTTSGSRKRSGWNRPAATDAPLPMLSEELPFLLDRKIHIIL